MTTENMALWDAVEKTNPAHTKAVTFGRKITAVDPYQQVRNATEQFGPAGKGWGWSVERVEYLPTNEIALLVRLWHGDKSNTFDHWGQASLFIDKAEQKKDTDCFKKATTDGLTKCLSFLGFNADVFLGKFDDNKYVAEMKEEFKPIDRIIEQIKGAAANNKTTWVRDNWSGVIAEKWQSLDQVTIDKLSILINQ